MLHKALAHTVYVIQNRFLRKYRKASTSLPPVYCAIVDYLNQTIASHANATNYLWKLRCDFALAGGFVNLERLKNVETHLLEASHTGCVSSKTCDFFFERRDAYMGAVLIVAAIVWCALSVVFVFALAASARRGFGRLRTRLPQNFQTSALRPLS